MAFDHNVVKIFRLLFQLNTQTQIPCPEFEVKVNEIIELLKITSLEKIYEEYIKEQLDLLIIKNNDYNLGKIYNTKKSNIKANRNKTTQFISDIASKMKINENKIKIADKNFTETTENLISTKNVFNDYKKSLYIASNFLKKFIRKNQNDYLFLLYSIRFFNIICIILIARKLYLLKVAIITIKKSSKLARYLIKYLYPDKLISHDTH